jgi:hypothetical protein
MTELRQENLAKDALNSQKNAEMVRKLESIEVKDGKLIIKPRPRDQRNPGEEPGQRRLEASRKFLKDSAPANSQSGSERSDSAETSPLKS